MDQISLDPLRSQLKEIREHWNDAYQKASASPEAWQPHYPGGSLEVVEESLRTAENLLVRRRAPTGFSPGFHLAQSLASLQLPPLLASAKQLSAANYAHLPSFAGAIMALLNAVHTLAIFSRNEDTNSVRADLQAELGQSIAAVQTAQIELAAKHDELKRVDQLVSSIESSHEKIGSIEAECEEKADDLKSQAEEAIRNLEAQTADAKKSLDADLESSSTLVEETRERAKESDDLQTRASKLVAEGESLQKRLNEITDIALQQQRRTGEQQDLIASLLPRGASAGLAAAFGQRERSLEWIKWGWMAVFIVSIGFLATFAHTLLNSQLPPGISSYWAYFGYRITLASPLIWLGWFSAVQYGNTIRVQEDYAFKEATSKAFQGYRDHMEHLKSVADEDAGTALNLMSAKTIEILAREPLRIYDRTHHDASPASSLVRFFQRNRKAETEQK